MHKAKLIEQAATEITKELTDKGKLIEAGFAAFAHFVIPKDAPAVQVSEMRLAFMAGADHLFSSIMSIMDPGEEPSDADLRRMDLIHKELGEWRGTIAEHIQPSQGRA
jgi:hypothetical protein